MVGNEHADAAFLQVLDKVLNLDDRNRVDAGERFVEQDEARRGRERARDLHAPALAAGEADAEGVAPLGDMQVVQQLLEQVRALVDRQLGARLEDRHDVFLDRQVAEHRRLLRQIPHAEARAPVHGQGTHVGVIERDAAAIHRHQPHDHVEASGLAGAVRAEQTDDLAAFDFERHASNHAPALVLLREIVRGEPAHGFGPADFLRGCITAYMRSSVCGPPRTITRSVLRLTCA